LTLQPSEFYYLNESYTEILELAKLAKNDKVCDQLIPDIVVTQFQKLINEYNMLLDVENLKDLNFQGNITAPIFRVNQYQLLDSEWKRQNDAMEILKKISADLAKTIGDEPYKIESMPSIGYFIICPASKKKVLNLRNWEYRETQGQIKILSPEIRKLSDIIVNSIERINKLSKRFFQEYLDKINSNYLQILEIIANFSNHLDLVSSVGLVSVENKYCRPKIIEKEKSYVVAKNLRHPIIEKCNPGVRYVENDVDLGRDVDGMMLFSLNGSGKTILEKSLGISLILAQAGFFVPATEYIYKPYEKILTTIAIIDNIYKGRSTFQNEVLVMNSIIENSNQNTLILADELARGTEPSSAIGLIVSTVLRLQARKSSFIIISHHHDILDISEIDELPKVKPYYFNMILNPETREIIYDRKLIQGKSHRRYGVEIAECMGLDKDFIKTAYRIRDEYDGVKALVDAKSSKYNANVFMNQCGVCNSSENLNTHHIVFQKEFEIEGHQIPFDKNIEHNLAVICERCHQEVHHGILIIRGYLQTSNGIKLEYLRR
jgi:DNA mismatch repair protein MutS